ncbi:MAG: FlgO family outer membrane protein [Planctomycetota bacterium]
MKLHSLFGASHIRGKARGLFGLTVLGFLAACGSTPEFENTATDLSTEILDQLEVRMDPGAVRLFIDEFQPCNLGKEGEMIPMTSEMAVSHRLSAERLRHEMMGSLAPNVIVLDRADYEENPVRGRENGSARPLNRFERALQVGANSILLGNFAMDGERILVMARVVDARNHNVLAAVEGYVPHSFVVGPRSKMDH